MHKKAIFPGSFDPFTKGHEDIVLRGLKIFDEVIIGIGHNTKKQRYFPVEAMAESIKEHFIGVSGIDVIIYNELTANLAKKLDANYILRGLRNTTDFEYENSISQVNRNLNEDIETVFLITSPIYAAVNSSIIREIHRYGADISTFVPFDL
jgi:pantetheine-phosphate adenylyltransferase